MIHHLTGRGHCEHAVTWIYGDSFVADPGDQDHLPWFYQWSLELGPWVCNRAQGGSSIEQAIWLWYRDHCQGQHHKGDRVLIAITEENRLYQTNITNANAATAHAMKTQSPQWRAIDQYYEHIWPNLEEILPLRTASLLVWLDQQLAASPAETLIAHSFPAVRPLDDLEITARDLEQNCQRHWFRNADNMWPSLMYFAAEQTLRRDPRPNHLDQHQHDHIAKQLREQGQGTRWLVPRQGCQNLRRPLIP